MKEKFVILLVLVVIFATGAITIAASRLDTIGGPEVEIPVYNDAQLHQDWCGLGDIQNKFYGHFSDGTDQGEIFERSTIWYSWTREGESFPVMASMEVGNCGWIPPNYPSRVAYTFQYTEDRKTWVGFGTQKYPEGVITVYPNLSLAGYLRTELGSQTFTIRGYDFYPCLDYHADDNSITCKRTGDQTQRIKDGAVLRVRVYVGSNALIGGYAYRLAGWDELQLRSAIPYVSWVKQSYKVGETAQVDWVIPTVADQEGDPAYFLQIINCNTNSPISGMDRIPLTKVSGRHNVPVLDSYFSNDLATCQNRLRAVIWTELIRTALADTSIQKEVGIEIGEPPVVTEIKFDKSEYFEGDNVHISWKVSGNVTKIHVTIHINGLIVRDEDLKGTERSLDFRAARSGTAQVEVTAYNKCQPSAVKKEFAVIGGAPPEICQAYPELPICNPAGDLWGKIIAALIILGLFLLFFVVWWLLAKVGDLPPYVNFLIAFSVVAVVFLGLLALGFFDPLLLSIAGRAAGVIIPEVSP